MRGEQWQEGPCHWDMKVQDTGHSQLLTARRAPMGLNLFEPALGDLFMQL